jgi:uncharacterized membrane protein YphA (DoxX/SURF4 family)/peroxiredoxin
VIVLWVRLLLAGVFVVAGISKLVDRGGVRGMLLEFGSPARFVTPVAWVLVSCELGVGAALLFGRSARIGGSAALVLLIAFAAAVGIAVSRGRRPECRWFGRLRASEVGWSTVARNALLATGAAFVVADGHDVVIDAALAVLAGGLWIALALSESRPTRAGAGAPELSLVDGAGQTWSLGSLLGEVSPLLLVFSNPQCGACQELMPALVRWQRDHLDGVNVVVVSAGAREDQRDLAAEQRVGTVLFDEQDSTTVAYGIAATPTAVLVDAERRVAAAPAVGADQITQLLTRTIAEREEVGFQRRALLARAALAVASVTLVPLVESAVATAASVKHKVRPKALKVDGAWLCDQRFALCTTASCEPSKTNPNISVCRCKVTSDYSVGFKSCEQRKPTGRQLHSNFSLLEVTDRTRVLTCKDKGLWVQCLDVVCELDRNDPKHADCQCVNMRTKNFVTFGGNCDTRTCKTTIWSATSTPYPGGAQLEKGLKRLGIPFKVPKSCPTPSNKQ